MTSRLHHVAERTCVGCGERDRQSVLVRFALAEGGEVVASGRHRAGRGAYVHMRSDCIAGLARSRRLERSLRTRVERGARERFAERLEPELMATGNGR